MAHGEQPAEVLDVLLLVRVRARARVRVRVWAQQAVAAT